MGTFGKSFEGSFNNQFGRGSQNASDQVGDERRNQMAIEKEDREHQRQVEKTKAVIKSKAYGDLTSAAGFTENDLNELAKAGLTPGEIVEITQSKIVGDDTQRQADLSVLKSAIDKRRQAAALGYSTNFTPDEMHAANRQGVDVSSANQADSNPNVTSLAQRLRQAGVRSPAEQAAAQFELQAKAAQVSERGIAVAERGQTQAEKQQEFQQGLDQRTQVINEMLSASQYDATQLTIQGLKDKLNRDQSITPEARAYLTQSLEGQGQGSGQIETNELDYALLGIPIVAKNLIGNRPVNQFQDVNFSYRLGDIINTAKNSNQALQRIKSELIPEGKVNEAQLKQLSDALGIDPGKLQKELGIKEVTKIGKKTKFKSIFEPGVTFTKSKGVFEK